MINLINEKIAERDLYLVGLGRNVVAVFIVGAGGNFQMIIERRPLYLRLLGVGSDLGMPPLTHRHEIIQHQACAVDVLTVTPFLHLIAEDVLELPLLADGPARRVDDAIVVASINFICGEGCGTDTRSLLFRQKRR